MTVSTIFCYEDLQKPLPTLPPAINELLPMLMDDEVEPTLLEKKLLLFPSLCARLLMVANSNWSDSLSKIISVRYAILRLGRDIVRSISITLIIAERFDPKRCPEFDARRFWLTAMLTTQAVDYLPPGFKGGQDDGEAWSTAGLLHNLGLLWLTEHFPRQIGDIFQLTLSENRTVSELLRSTLGVDYASVGAKIAEAWAFPTPLVKLLIQHHQNPQKAGKLAPGAAAIGAFATISNNLISNHDWCEDVKITTYYKYIPKEILEPIALKLEQILPKKLELANVLFP